jgi:hypothetical protein
MSWENIKDRAIFIGGHRKSGTTLFSSLLDHHPHLYVYPGESAFFYKYFPIFDRPDVSLEQKEARVFEALLPELAGTVRAWMSPEGREESVFDLDRAIKLYRENIAMTHRRTSDYYATLVQTAWELLVEDKDQKQAWVDKTTSIEIYADTLFTWYPKAQFIHILRDPRDNYASIKSGWEKEYQKYFDSHERLLQSVIDRAKLGMQIAERNLLKYGERQYFILRFEDLVSQPQKIMEQVCAFLNIPFRESLLTPSFGGVPWKGNSFTNQSFSDISARNVNRWRAGIKDHEAKVLEYYFSGLMEKYGYQPVYSVEEQVQAAVEHYKWFNYAQPYSLKVPCHQGVTERS